MNDFARVLTELRRAYCKFVKRVAELENKLALDESKEPSLYLESCDTSPSHDTDQLAEV